MSAAVLTHFKMVTITVLEFNEQVNKIVESSMEPSGYEQYVAEKEHIMNLKDAEEIVSCMRKIKEPSNSSLLIQTAITYQDDVMPLVLKKYVNQDMIFL